ncbi:hypothetical protein BO99DRAFT_35896 [Aspergillus violaceofuscus CBS 115571]|uniref:Uncharacterized protein n=1 Tax=Aspergillus violaceofuscus (strain CBS 115571) TaxID=1450538 RepID=A0A2V5GXN7_ASPV1|nr:hypothetical protein BO99DRAFT_35896 [Aspergillus violaceofuscus CBS 115571]
MGNVEYVVCACVLHARLLSGMCTVCMLSVWLCCTVGWAWNFRGLGVGFLCCPAGREALLLVAFFFWSLDDVDFFFFLYWVWGWSGIGCSGGGGDDVGWYGGGFSAVFFLC